MSCILLTDQVLSTYCRTLSTFSIQGKGEGFFMSHITRSTLSIYQAFPVAFSTYNANKIILEMVHTVYPGQPKG